MTVARKRQAKQKKRERAVRKRKLAAQRENILRAKRELYPDIVLGRRDADPEFIELVAAASKQIDFLDTKLLGSGQNAFYRLGKEVGFAEAFRILQSAPTMDAGECKALGNQLLVIIGVALGGRILSKIPVDKRRRFMPINDVAVRFRGRDIVLNFSSMASQSGAGGRVYYSRSKPKVCFDKIDYTVAFSTHAIERICSRIYPNYYEYGPSGDVHAFFNSCVYYEPVTLFGGQPAFILYDICDTEGFVQRDVYTVGVLGLENVKPNGGRIYNKVGYCPVVFEGEFAKAKTFIPPGYTNTPEYGLLVSSHLPRAEKDRLIAKVTDPARTEFDTLSKFDCEAAKWFHENGVPQVVQMKQEVFRYC